MTIEDFIKRGIKKGMTPLTDRPLTREEIWDLHSLAHACKKAGFDLLPVHQYFTWDFCGIGQKEYYGRIIAHYAQKTTSLFINEEHIPATDERRLKLFKQVFRYGW